MKYIKVGDAVSTAYSSAAYLVTAVRRFEVLIKSEQVAPFLVKKDKLQYAITVPDWIIKWREENMPPAPTEPLEPPANTEETKTVRILARENARLAADLTTTQSALSLTERDNLNLRIGARNDCDNIELLNTCITEMKEETDVHKRRCREAERALAAEKVHNENHAEHISKLCEELSNLKRARDVWMNNNARNVKRVINLQEELAAEKAFNVSTELVARTGASDEIDRLKAIQANATSQIIHWRDRAEALQLKLSNINAMTREENDDG